MKLYKINYQFYFLTNIVFLLLNGDVQMDRKFPFVRFDFQHFNSQQVPDAPMMSTAGEK